uniref:Myeloid cell leukemia protein n=1 Tax=Cyprinus carpio TaxID=7962 RepID=B2L8N7_CYPCA|nr:myeloid cell leukemia protein [Cyprinus carpio]
MALSLDFRRWAAGSRFQRSAAGIWLLTSCWCVLQRLRTCALVALCWPRPGTNGLKGLQLDGLVRVRGGTGSLPATPPYWEFPLSMPARDVEQPVLLFRDQIAGMCPVDRKLHHAIPTMKRVVDNILVKHQIAYKGMIQRLQLDSQPASLDFIRCIASTMFKDGVTNWGRIASLVAFGAVVCSRLKELQQDQCVERVAEQISSYLTSVVRHGLLALVGCAGIGAGLAFLIR